MSLKRYKHQIGVGALKLSDHEKQLVNEVLDSNRLTYGPMTKKFEAEFAKSHEVKFSLFLNSGTSALHVALGALKARHGWSDGDEIIVPSITFVATANVVLHNRMTPVFVDVEPDTFNIDPGKIERMITPRTRAIIPVHLLGLPAAMGPVLDIAKRHDLSVIEDSCEAMFAKYGNQMVGSIGDIGCFSTYVAHYIVTGVGGLSTTNDPELAADMKSLLNHGRDNIYISCSDDQDASGEKLKEIIERRFSFVNLGHSFRCTEMEAAIGLGQLRKSGDIITRRLEVAQKFNEGLADLQDRIQLPSCPPDRTHSYMLYGILAKNDQKRALVEHLETLNIETRDLLPLINQPIYKNLYGDLEARYPIARMINNSGFYIGCHPYMTNEEVDFVIEAFHDFFKLGSN